MATFTRGLQYDQSQQNEIMPEALRKALAEAETARAEAETARAEADMELKRVEDLIKQEILKREKEYEPRLAQVDANVLAEVASTRGSLKSLSAIFIIGAAGRKLAFDKDIGNVKKPQKECVKE